MALFETSSQTYGDVSIRGLSAQFNSVIRVMDNSRGYRLGNEFSFTAWGAYNLSDWMSVSMRGLFERWGDVSGSDPGTDGTRDPSANSFAQGGERVQIPFGVS